MPENIEQESKKIPETLKVHHVERFEVKVRTSNLAIPNGIQTRKMVSFAGTKLQMLMTTTVLCALKQRKEEWIQCPGLCQQWYHE